MPARILIVEDDLDTQQMLREYFLRLGHHVSSSAFGSEAVAAATQLPPDLILLDIRLPDFDGYEVCRRLRAQQRTVQVPIIFLTEKREREDRLAGLQLGAVDYLTKPFDINELRLRVENVLQRAGFRPLDHPVTGLPGERLLLEYLADLDAHAGWVLTRIDLEGLEAFVETHGFVSRDDLLRAVAAVLRTVAAQDNSPAQFIAHEGNAHFYLVTGTDFATQLPAQLSARLPQVLIPFYPVQERECWPPPVPVYRIITYLGSIASTALAGQSSAMAPQLAYKSRNQLICVP